MTCLACFDVTNYPGFTFVSTANNFTASAVLVCLASRFSYRGDYKLATVYRGEGKQQNTPHGLRFTGPFSAVRFARGGNPASARDGVGAPRSGYFVPTKSHC
jgi:hypothetical protein